MMLDIYAISAGAIGKAQWYGSMESEEFKARFPKGFDPIYNKAKEMGTDLIFQSNSKSTPCWYGFVNWAILFSLCIP